MCFQTSSMFSFKIREERYREMLKNEVRKKNETHSKIRQKYNKCKNESLMFSEFYKMRDDSREINTSYSRMWFPWQFIHLYI